MTNSRAVHYLLLAAVMAIVSLPNLGVPSLWDVDEGVNVGCTREMMESGTWVVPTFNGELRTAKPVMLYWIQRLSFLAFGIDEWAARLPAVLLGLGTVLLTYELARRMFDAATGLLSGIVLATAIEFCKLSHAATPDAPLIFFIALTLHLFWIGHEHGSRAWMYPAAFASGLATLTKGPIGLAMPAIIVLLYFAWNRELKRLLDWRLIRAILLWILVAAPWYGLVISETRGAYLAFFKNENAGRFLNAMEGHRGPLVYYVGAIFVFFAPWCAVLGGAVWYGVRAALPKAATANGGLPLADARAHRFLLCWAGVYLVFFSLAATKLPNYIAPLYPALAILTARYLMRWRNGELALPAWVMPLAIAGVVLVGVVTLVGLLIAGGAIPVNVKGLRIMPTLAPWAWVGGIPIAAAGAMALAFARGRRDSVIAALAIGSIAYIGTMAAFVTPEVDAYKAPKALVFESGAHDIEREVRVGSYDYTQPSVTHYVGRKVERIFDKEAVARFLAMPLPVYLFVPAKTWDEQLAGHVATPHRIAARKYDFLRNGDVLVITNQ
ncbi:MAG: glycosyltransferase family 39 protein [Planctomycetia bacterium]|nr:glycosyltransferase family 39 protein [Planctomycetia bacterium]